MWGAFCFANPTERPLRPVFQTEAFSMEITIREFTDSDMEEAIAIWNHIKDRIYEDIIPHYHIL